jgi:very-short-patch-repair endonuclease
MRDKLVARRDLAAARVAARQHGVIGTEQLHTAGIDKSAIARRAKAGRLHRIHRGVYAVGHAGLSPKGRWKAATLACGEGAVLSHRSAAELWELLKARDGPVHVTVPVASGRARRDGIRVHRRPSLTAAETTLRDGIPVTSPSRTLTDLRASLPPGEFRRAVRQAEIRGLPIDPRALVPDGTASELERAFLRLCRREKLPMPEVNVWVGRDRVDFLWRRHRVVVETDSYRYHRGRVAFENDHARENRLIENGFEILRFTYSRVINEPDAVAALVRRRLAVAARRVALE